MEYPITVTDITSGEKTPLFGDGWRDLAGRFVSVRPVKSIDPDEKTYLGLYIGDINFSWTASHNKETGVLTIDRGDYGNPAIYVFDLKRVVMGYESWWGVIRSEDQLEQITNADINDIWYVKALKAISERADEEE